MSSFFFCFAARQGSPIIEAGLVHCNLWLRSFQLKLVAYDGIFCYNQITKRRKV